MIFELILLGGSDTLPFYTQKWTKRDGRYVEVKCKKPVEEKGKIFGF